MSKVNPIDMEYDEFLALMKVTAANLKLLREHQALMRRQFQAQEFDDLRGEVVDALDGWISSNC